MLNRYLLDHQCVLLCVQSEMDLFQSEAACHSPLEKQYHTEVRALLRTKGRRNQRVFTYTEHDRFTSLQQLVGLQWHAHVSTKTRTDARAHTHTLRNA